MTIYFAPIGSGIGDVIVCKPAAEWLVQNSQDKVVYVLRGPRQVGLSKFVEGISGEVLETDLDSRLMKGDRLINLRDHKLQCNHDWFSRDFKARFPALRIEQILEQICKEFGIYADHSEIKALPFQEATQAQGKIILVPGTTLKSKKLKVSFWKKLNAELKKQGKECIVLGSLQNSLETQELVAAGITHIPTEDLQVAIDLISSCAGVVSVDTGLMHIAVQQGVPTVSIFGICEVYYRPAKNCFPIFTDTQLIASRPEREYPQHNFPAVFSNWDYFPSNADDGELIDFEDHNLVIDILSTNMV